VIVVVVLVMERRFEVVTCPGQRRLPSSSFRESHAASWTGM